MPRDTLPVDALTHAAPAISRDAAQALLHAARAACDEIGIEVAIAITDAGGHLKAYERSDHAPFLTSEVAINKAWTAASFGLPTHTWNTLLQNPEITALANTPRLMPVGGGYPVKAGGRVVGGIGISGGNALQDQQAAETALKAVGFELA